MYPCGGWYLEWPGFAGFIPEARCYYPVPLAPLIPSAVQPQPVGKRPRNGVVIKRRQTSSCTPRYQGPSQYKEHYLTCLNIPIIKIRRSWDRLIFILGILTIVKMVFILKRGHGLDLLFNYMPYHKIWRKHIAQRFVTIFLPLLNFATSSPAQFQIIQNLIWLLTHLLKFLGFYRVPIQI